ncbi:MAG TPA: SRPBCC family protein [Flavobacteriaceae bacterium]|nr:SRPBCC family protein [Flavobacteriaceae bacterium]
MRLESQIVTLNKTALETCQLLSDVKNFERLMPENISKFEIIRENAFVFALKGMPEIALEVKEVATPNKVVLGAISDKLPFTLTAQIQEIATDTSEVQLFFEGEFNAMMAMMIKGPITKFLETLTSNMKTL